MLNWRLNVSTNCATFSGIALTVGRKSNIQFNQTNFLYTIVAWAAIAPTGSRAGYRMTTLSSARRSLCGPRLLPNSIVCVPQLARDNHFVPEGYLRISADAERKMWCLRL